MSEFPSFLKLSNFPLYVHIIVYPFICSWTLELFPLFSLPLFCFCFINLPEVHELTRERQREVEGESTPYGMRSCCNPIPSSSPSCQDFGHVFTCTQSFKQPESGFRPCSAVWNLVPLNSRPVSLSVKWG